MCTNTNIAEACAEDTLLEMPATGQGIRHLAGSRLINGGLRRTNACFSAAKLLVCQASERSTVPGGTTDLQVACPHSK